MQASDLLRLRSVADVAFSPDGTRLAYVVDNNDGTGRPYATLWVMTVADGKSVRVGGADDHGSEPTWSPDSRWLAFDGRIGGKGGLFVAGADGSAPRFLAETDGTNSPNPNAGKTITWSPDSQRIAFVSAVPGPETKDANGDPMIITRYLYKPDFWEGNSHFNDNKRTHVFVIDAAGGTPRQLTTGNYYEHSIDWAPSGDEIVFVSNREPDPDRIFNNDLFTVSAATGAVRRLTATEGCEFQPRWSPDGKMIAYRATKRGLTDLETNMEDTHVWVMNADGTGRREIGAAINNRQGAPAWTGDGAALLFTVQERGSNHLYRLPVAGGKPEMVVGDAGFVGTFAARRDNAIAYTFAGRSDTTELFLKSGAAEPRRLMNLNAGVLGGKQLAPVESFTFISNDNKWNVEAFLTRPLNWKPEGKYPLIVVIHGGPHGQQGPAFNFKNQVYAAHGYATLMVNFRGSTGYGQEFADAVFRDQDGDEGMDVLYGVGAALRRYRWLDPDRLGIEGVSYGGQLTAWLITQTSMFKAAIPTAAITNFISYNYMTYYNQYEEMEWGARPHQGKLMDVLWERSPLKHVAKAKTPTLLVHGENDPDVPIAESEQFYIALKDVGVETVFARYPREGHGLREPKHLVDWITRSLAWYDAHFAAVK
ncbi:MAG TPA: S9 family peptidase [Terriglobales bacterium]|nr:S9 family peptidase [Terriglobales bacterium]